MRAPHLLRVTAPPGAFAPLAAAMSGEGLRLGWLELAGQPPAPLPEGPAAALDLGVLRAVSVGPGLVVSAKPLRGDPVLRDLLREHFRGCRLVLVTGPGAPEDLAALGPADDGAFRVRTAGAAEHRWTPGELAARLRRARPWDDGSAG